MMNDVKQDDEHKAPNQLVRVIVRVVVGVGGWRVTSADFGDGSVIVNVEFMENALVALWIRANAR